MLEHAALSYNIPYAFGPDDCILSIMSATTPESDFAGFCVGLRTFIFANILQCKRQIGVFSFNDAYFAKGSSADNSQESKMVEVYCDRPKAVVSQICGQCDGAQARNRSK